jgi:hypothetical protein
VAEKNLTKVEQLVLDSINEIVTKGIADQQIESAIHQIEFDTREISGGHYPYSLNLLFRFFGTWVHGGNPITAIDFDNTLNELKAKLKKGPFLEQQIKKYLIENPHRVKIVLKPDKELEAKRMEQLQKQLEQIKSRMSPENMKKVISDSKLLIALQEKKEDLSCLPSLQVNDIPKEIKFVDPIKKGLNELDVTFFERPTNGIVYFTWYFKMDRFPESERIWLPLLCNILMNTGAGDLSYEAMSEQINLYTGGFSSSPHIETQIHETDLYKEFFTVSSKALNRNQGQLFDLASLLMGPRKFDELSRIEDLIVQRTNSLVNSIVQNGHNYAVSLASRNFAKSALVEELYSGIHQVKFMKRLGSPSTSDLQTIVNHLNYLLGTILDKNHLSMLVIGDQLALKESEKHITRFVDGLAASSVKDDLSATKQEIAKMQEPLSVDQQYEAWVTTTPVSYVARSFKTISYTHEDSAKLFVLSNLLKSCFLHGEIREKGGAYGAMSSYSPDEGIFNLISYRDPNLARTVAVYEKAFDWLSSGNISEREVAETILQTCSNMDTPMSPAGKALVEYVNERKGKTKTDREHFRRNVLSCSKKDLIRAGEQHLKADVHTVAITSETIVKRDQPGNATNPFRIIPI